MGSIQILLGKTRVRRRRGISRGELSGVDRYGRPNFLYITDTVRKSHAVEAEFLQYRDGAAFIPTVTTLSALLEDLAVRHGDGRACWTPGGTALVAERLIVATPGEFPWLAALGDPERVGRAAADLALAWDEADRPVLDARPELTRFLARLLALLEADRARRPLGEALRQLTTTLGRPRVALAQWLAAPHAILIDDVLHPSPLRRRVLIAMARAWSTLGKHVVFSFESGRDLGGAEAGRFFDYDDDDSVAFPLRPFQATRAFRRSLFASLVAEGGEADLVVAGRDGLYDVGPGDEPGLPEPADIADLLYTDTDAVPEAVDATGQARLGFATGPAAPRLVKWSDPASEVRGIAHAVKARLLAGTPPERLWVAFPGLPGYLPLVRRIFGELGVPVDLSAGRPVRARPAAEVVLVAARTAAEGFPLAPLLAVIASDLVGAMSQQSALGLARTCRERGVFKGHPSAWRARLEQEDLERHDSALTGLSAACDRLLPLAQPMVPSAWRDHLCAVVAEWGLVAHADAAVDPEARTASLVALGRVLDAVDQAAQDAASVDPGPWDTLRLARLLEEHIGAARMPGSAGGVGLSGESSGNRTGVQVVGMLELRGIHPPWLWVGGLVADDFPARPDEDFLLSRTARSALDRLDPGDEARYLFASTLRNAMDGGDTLTLSWPATRDDRPIAISPLVEDLLEVCVGGQPLRKRVEAGVVPTTPAAPAELDALVGEAAAIGAAADAWHPFMDGAARLDRIRQVVSARRDTTGFGPWDGVLERPPAAPARLAVTRFEEYLACPSRYLHHQLLHLGKEEQYDPDLGRPERGMLLHGILEDFLKGVYASGRAHLRGLTADERDMFARALYAAATGRLDADREVAGLVAPLASWHRTRWLAGLVDDAPKGLLAAWLDAEIESTLPTTLYKAEHPFRGLMMGPIALEGRIDRVDRLQGGGALVIDYKSGRAPKADHVRAGLKVQGFVYLEAMVASGLEQGPRDAEGSQEPRGAAVYQELRNAAELQYAGWVGDPDTLSGFGTRKADTVALADAERALLRDHLVAAGQRLADGRFHPSLAGAERAGCAWCEFRRSCRVDHVRNAAIAAHRDPRWQAPLESEGNE